MKVYRLDGVATVKAFTVINADSEDEAMEIASKREIGYGWDGLDPFGSWVVIDEPDPFAVLDVTIGVLCSDPGEGP
jgi:hypothetical protein